MQNYVTCKPVVKIVRKCEDHGHWECREVPCEPSCWDRIKARCSRKKNCCECCEPCCVKTKTVKCWVPCKVWVECPVTCYERVCVQRPVTVKCCTYKTEVREEKCQVTVCKYVAEQKTEHYTVMCTRMVPYPATRTFQVCVPHVETVTCCRMVAKTVVKQVPCEPTCCTPCCCPSNCGKASKCHR